MVGGGGRGVRVDIIHVLITAPGATMSSVYSVLSQTVQNVFFKEIWGNCH